MLLISNNTAIKEEIAATSISYKVKKGETLSSISKKYDVTEDELKASNNLKSNALRLASKPANSTNCCVDFK